MGFNCRKLEDQRRRASPPRVLDHQEIIGHFVE
jgi:hypothetical protein